MTICLGLARLCWVPAWRNPNFEKPAEPVPAHRVKEARRLGGPLVRLPCERPPDSFPALLRAACRHRGHMPGTSFLVFEIGPGCSASPSRWKRQRLALVLLFLFVLPPFATWLPPAMLPNERPAQLHCSLVHFQGWQSYGLSICTEATRYLLDERLIAWHRTMFETLPCEDYIREVKES